MEALDKKFHDLLEDKTKAFAVLTTISKDHIPVMSPIWFLVEDNCIAFTTDDKSVKGKNIKARPQVGLVLMSEGNFLRYIEIRGKVIEPPKRRI
jgi:general stress protein 26